MSPLILNLQDVRRCASRNNVVCVCDTLCERCAQEVWVLLLRVAYCRCVDAAVVLRGCGVRVTMWCSVELRSSLVCENILRVLYYFSIDVMYNIRLWASVLCAVVCSCTTHARMRY